MLKLFGDLKRVPQIDHHWLFIWAFIFASFITLDLINPLFIGGALIKYVGIFLVVVYAHQKFRHDHLLVLALLFTLLADTVLVWTNQLILGVFCFCFAQFFHTARLAGTSPKALLGYYASITLVFVFAVYVGITPIYAIAAIYAVALFMNLTIATRLYTKDRHNFRIRYLFYGFILFVLCDLSVATSYLAHTGTLPAAIYGIAGFLVWVFYYPSQIFLSNSSLEKINKLA